MPERWQDELKKLRREQMPDGVRERVEAGPRRELPNDGRQRLVAGVVAFAVFIAAGAFAWRAFESGDVRQPAVDDTGAVVVDLAADPFSASLTYEETTQRGIPNGIVWDNAGASGGPYAVLFDSFVQVPTGTPITIRSDAFQVAVSLEGYRNPPGPARTVSLAAGTGALNASPGRYRLHVTGTWGRGSATFAFGIEIVEGGSSAVLITLNGTQDGPVATLASGDRTQDGARESYGWCNGDDCSGIDAEYVDYPPVPGYLFADPGAPFESAGDGELTRLVIRTTEGDFQSANVVQDTDGTGAVVPAEPGRYAVWISATWGDRGHGTFYFGIEVILRPEEAPDLLHVTCTPKSATADPGVVRAQADGVHIAVDASDAVTGAEIVTGTTPEEFFGVGVDPQEDGSRGTPIEPGSWSIGCYAGVDGGVAPSDIGTGRVATFRVVDPDGVYVPVDLACADATTRLFAVTGTPSSGVDGAYEASPQTVRESTAAVPGILPTDVVREAGYADGPGFKSGPLYTVLRDGRAVARLHVPVEVSGSWRVSVDACPGTGIGPDAPPGATGPTPDTVVVRCIGARAEVSTPIVNAQADGLHLEVEAADGTRAVTVASGWDRHRTFTVPVPDQGLTSSIVVPARPGHVQISCRTNDGSDPGDDPFADRRSDGLQLQDPAGYFLPYAPTCDSSEEVPIATAGAGVLPSSDTAIRARVAGIRDDDVVERAGYLEGRGDEGLWRVVRDGEVVAQILYPAETGIACRGSGIAGA